ncbi:50S ribosome-binding GTPase [Plantactinospora sp. S1510]|uniref:50S ribosome-binding GTPase n=1 Tax=Plantactinospora alkalitolerans TaxID=2789879 RepID=A0ABS0GVS7_9ACTN|nr:GTPase [Plantactinospora alkalitolerans]MBF9130312.1 50S ribosome-binding GTPase [Plantactinospora alkalitolerans]
MQKETHPVNVLQRVRKIVARQVEVETAKPFVVSVMGTTGTGKSSLINALFGTDLRTDPVRPCTKDVQTVRVDGSDGSHLLFHDLPGIGEAGTVDESYIAQYRTRLLESDVVLWAIHADSRSVTFDQHALDRVLGDSPAERVALMSRLTFLLTKADLLTPAPWIFSKSGGVGMFAAMPATAELLAEKERYFQDAFILPHAADLVSSTHHDGTFDVSESGLAFDQHLVSHRGLLTSEAAEALSARHPRHRDVFQRLHDNHRVISCSARLRFNLANLMFVIVNKLGPGAAVRFQKFTSPQGLNTVSVETARRFCNLVVFDQARGKVLFDMADQELGDRR